MVLSCGEVLFVVSFPIKLVSSQSECGNSESLVLLRKLQFEDSLAKPTAKPVAPDPPPEWSALCRVPRSTHRNTILVDLSGEVRSQTVVSA
jgi:hypothetical protein